MSLIRQTETFFISNFEIRTFLLVIDSSFFLLILILIFYRTLGSDLWVRMSVRPSVTETPFVDLTGVTLADEDTNSILTDNANRAIQGNVATN